MDTAAGDKNYTEENAQQAIVYAEKMLKDALFSLLMLKDCQHGPNAMLKAELSNRARISASCAVPALLELRDWHEIIR